MAFRYNVDKFVRMAMMTVLGRLTPRAATQNPHWQDLSIRRVLVVRGVFRMGSGILAMPAIELLRENFPHAQIDFVGPAITRNLFDGLALRHYYAIDRRFPSVCWSYLTLIRKLRARRYDLALDVSGSSAAMSAAIVGFSGARWRAGLSGRWDRWFNLRVTRPPVINKYHSLAALLDALGLKSRVCYPRINLKQTELFSAEEQLARKLLQRSGPVVGIFIGGRKKRGKRWPLSHFLEVTAGLRAAGARTIVFVGPEERQLKDVVSTLDPESLVIFEADVRVLAGLVACCDLFVSCDSGPMHLAAAVGVPTVAIFLKNNAERWGPPTKVARIVDGSNGVSPEQVLDACARELTVIAGRHKQAAVNA